jgi:hypothetical protein
LLGATGIAIWRRFHRPSVASSAIGLGACCAAMYTAYLGGEMVYAHGVGVDGNGTGPAVFSRAAPGALIRDTLRGAAWLGRRTREWARGERKLELGVNARGLLA